MVYRKLHEYFKKKIKTIPEYDKMTRAVSQPGNADSFRTPGLNSSVYAFIKCYNESASVIPYLILAVKSFQEV